MELALTDGRQTWRLRKGEILQIEKQDSLWNGVGWGLSVSAAVLGRSDLSSEYLSATVGSIAIVVGVGIVIGAVVDANVHRTVYEARPTVWAVKRWLVRTGLGRMWLCGGEAWVSGSRGVAKEVRDGRSWQEGE